MPCFKTTFGYYSDEEILNEENRYDDYSNVDVMDDYSEDSEA